MRAVWLENKVLSFREDIPEPELLPGEALVKVRLAGICGTDLELVKGYYPYYGIPGHEFVGEIVDLGPGVTGVEIGDRVMVFHYSGCGHCKYCRIGYEQLCIHGFDYYGTSRTRGHGGGQGGGRCDADQEAHPARGCGEFRGHPDRWHGHRHDRPVYPHRRWLELHVSRLVPHESRRSGSTTPVERFNHEAQRLPQDIPAAALLPALTGVTGKIAEAAGAQSSSSSSATAGCCSRAAWTSRPAPPPSRASPTPTRSTS